MRRIVRGYQPVTNKATVLLLTLVVMSFGAFAQYRVDTRNAVGHADATEVVAANRH